ncbi:MAG: cyclic nucleotide-binding protein [Desulfobacteraceae bacterium]|nr:MAG: cyclic nucleotide-binding protein [Desulfobacteraceae bacterium]
MLNRIARWLDIHEKEVGLFLWTLTLLFIVRSSGILLNNYAETVFLKRYGVEFMPVVNMLNAVVTVVVMGIMGGLMQRYGEPDLLAGTFLFTGGSIIALRLMIPFGIDLIYPIMFMLKALYEVLLAMLFWNLANDLFNTRQSKRLFPLITAGGVIGQILGSFGTPLLVRWFNFDNLLVVYTLISILGAVVVWAMMKRFPALLMAEANTKAAPKSSSMRKEIQALWPLMKGSLLLRVMILLSLMPNVVIPIINYQFNYAVDQTYASETGLLGFFGWFRGVLNIISLILLLFVGRIYGRWGLPVALMFHPLNYITAFLAFFFRFDIISAVYARMSTNIIRATINIPATAVVMGLFPESFRAMVRPFLRGTVVRIGLFVGSGLILLSDPLFHPRFLSLVALPFVLAWLVAPIILKRRYATILSNLIRDNQFDLTSLEDKEVSQLFRDRSVQSQLVRLFQEAKDQDVLWYAQLMRHIQSPELDGLLLRRIPQQPVERQIALLEMLTSDAGAYVSPVLAALAAKGDPRLTLAVLKTVYRLGAGATAAFDRTPYLNHENPAIRAYAAAALYAQAPETATDRIQQWLRDDRDDIKISGIKAAGLSRATIFVSLLRSYLEKAEESCLLAETITSLHALGVHDLDQTMAALLQNGDQQVRKAALSAYHVSDRESLKTVIGLLSDPDGEIRRTAAERIEAGDYVDGKALIKALGTPHKEARELIFELLDRLQIKDPDVYRFARDQIEGAYKFMAESQGVRTLPDSPARALLLDYLDQQLQAQVENVLRVLSIEDRSGRMRIISRGLMSADPRQRANSQEAIDDLLDHSLTRILMPLLDDASPDQVLSIGRREFKLPDFRQNAADLVNHLLQRDDQLTVSLTLQFMLERKQGIDSVTLTPLITHDDQHIRKLARRLRPQASDGSVQEEHPMDEALTLPSIILLLKKIEIFEQLSVNELAAVASVTEVVSFPDNHTVIREGDAGDTLYLIIEGQVAVMKNQDGGDEIELDRMDAGDYFGEMALFEDIPRTATIRTLQSCRMLTLHKQEFKEMVREYPQIALDICKVLSGRIRKLHSKMTH